MLRLSSLITDLPRIGPAKAKSFKKLGALHIRDLLFTFPRRYEDFSQVTPIKDLQLGKQMTVHGRVKNVNANWGWQGRRRLLRIFVEIEDETGIIGITWYNLRFLQQQLRTGRELYVAGTVEPYKGKNTKVVYAMRSPAMEFADASNNAGQGRTHTAAITPVYSETHGVSSRFIRYQVKNLLPLIGSIPEYIPGDIIKRHGLLDIHVALRAIHFPQDQEELAAAERRLRFDELFFLQLAALVRRQQRQQAQAQPIPILKKQLEAYIKELPFALTAAQREALAEIMDDLAKDAPMNRLLQGDVGSGKSAVALIAARSVLETGYKVLYLAPTEILARQQAESFANHLGASEVKLLIGALSAREKQKIKQSLATPEPICVVGTHALLQEDVQDKNIGLVIVDEQHRFGVKQRSALLRGSTQMKTQIDADNDGDFLYKDLTYQIRGAVYEVSNELGLGLKEIVYQKALEEALKGRGIKFEREKILNVLFNKTKVGTFKPDLLVENKVIIELKALPFVGKTEERQLWTYLKSSKYKLALLVNFGSQELTIKRVVYDTARDSKDPRKSAFHLRESALEVTSHLLSMTATPIPRTLNLTVYGDLDVSVLDELPPGRQPITTSVVGPGERDEAIIHALNELHAGRQAYVIAPLVEESDKLELKSAKATYEEMKKLFPGIAVGLVHGQMSSEEKESAMRNFAAGAIQLLVATAVVEVGVNVPNATVMIIEGAERFGLAQLHQFRGRVGRGEHQSYCYLFPTTDTAAQSERLHVLAATTDGFKIAEEDLRLRGPGEIYGVAQSGFGDLKVASLLDYATIKLARSEAARILKKDPELKKYPILQKKVEQKNMVTHFE